jgi:hypothetical protein
MADLLTIKEVEQLTGIPASKPIRQRNRLMKQGIHCVINDAHQVIVWRSWVDQAALPKESRARYLSKLHDNDEPDDIGMKLSALNG